MTHHSSLNSNPGVQLSLRTFLVIQESKVLNPPPVLSCEIPLTPVEQFLPLADVNDIRIRRHLSEHSYQLLCCISAACALPVPSGPAECLSSNPLSAIQLQYTLQSHVALPSLCFSLILSLFNEIINFPEIAFSVLKNEHKKPCLINFPTLLPHFTNHRFFWGHIFLSSLCKPSHHYLCVSFLSKIL